MRGWRESGAAVVAVAVLGIATAACGGANAVPTSTTRSTTAPATTATPPSAEASASPWTTYHHDGLRSGVAPSGATFVPLVAAWTSPVLDGQLYGEPLVVGRTVVVATENDTVYALSAHTGRVAWSRHVGTPYTPARVCGDVTPTVGITSTPVIDPARDEVFVVADEEAGGGAAHHLVGLDMASGAVRMDQVIDPPGTDPVYMLQRAGLALDGGSVVVGFGGNFGDCGDYHGWVLAVPEGGGALHSHEVDAGPGERQGAVWMGGAAPVIDASGNLWVAAGNGSVTSPGGPYDGSDSVIELAPSMQQLQIFAPSGWYEDNATDADLGSTAPQLLGEGTVFQIGKSGVGYLLDQARLGGVGHPRASVPVCPGFAFGGDALSGGTLYVPCAAGVTALHVAPGGGGLSVAWTTPTGASGPPIVAGGAVWSIGGDGTLYGLDPATGGAVARASLGTEANHFPTPSVGDGLLLATSSDQVHAFSAR